MTSEFSAFSWQKLTRWLRSNGWAVGASAVLLVAAASAFWPILDNGFVWDDGGNLISARAQWGDGWRGVVWAFTESFAGHYQPLTWLSYRWDLWWSNLSPRGVHATQLALHLGVMVAVGLLARALARSPALRSREDLQGWLFPWVASALCGLAPIRVESVAWATERRDLLGALFAILATVFYLRSHSNSSAAESSSGQRVSWGICLLVLLSALSRAQMSLPFVFLVLDFWPLNRLDWGSWRALGRRVGEKAVLWAIAVASAVAAIWAQASGEALTAVAEHGLLDRLVQAGYGLVFYPVTALFPGILGPLLPLYERPSPFPASAAQYLLPALVGVALCGAAWLLRRRFPGAASAWVSYALLVAPVLGIAQSGIQLVADRYAYLATLPIYLGVAAGWCWWFGFGARRPLARGWAALALLVYLGAGWGLVRQQTRVWQDDLTLWRHVLASAPSSLADNNLGQILAARGEAGAAIFHLTRCLENSPRYGRPWRSLASLLEVPWPEGAPPALWVAETLNTALTHQPGSIQARFATALAWVRAGDAVRAEAEFRRILAVDPSHDGARLGLARLLAKPNEWPTPGRRLGL